MPELRPVSPPARGWGFRLSAVVLIAVSLTVPTGFWMARCMSDSSRPPAPPAAGAPTVGGVPLFATWPADRKPDAVIVLSGQTWGYMRPCGCSVNQKGGLERRANLIAQMKAKGWPVVAYDLGDIAAPKKVQEQDLLKYKYTMLAMRDMGYAAVGLGAYDFDQSLWQLLAQYTLQKPDDLPFVLSASLVGIDDDKKIVPRATLFHVGEGKRPMVKEQEATKVGKITVGAVGLIGPSVVEKVRKIDANFEFIDGATILKPAVGVLDVGPKKCDVKVLLYQGTKEEAIKAVTMYPQFGVVLCQIDEVEPSQFATPVNNGKTLVVQVGQKGQNVGVVGVFKNDDGTFDLKYQLVQLTEDFVTPDDPAKIKANPGLKWLDAYAEDVKRLNLMAEFTKRPQKHAAQINNPDANLTFAGSESCMKCHAAEYAVWKASSHSHAMEALEKKAVRPVNRQFDGECVVCHTVGFGQESGYVNDAKTPQLRNVGCESCHGPGSGHNANPNDKALLAALSPWKSKAGEGLPHPDILKKLAERKPAEPSPVQLLPAQQQTMTAVYQSCAKCHDPENDPKFDLNVYMPKIWHSGLKAAAPGLPPVGK